MERNYVPVALQLLNVVNAQVMQLHVLSAQHIINYLVLFAKLALLGNIHHQEMF